MFTWDNLNFYFIFEKQVFQIQYYWLKTFLFFYYFEHIPFPSDHQRFCWANLWSLEFSQTYSDLYIFIISVSPWRKEDWSFLVLHLSPWGLWDKCHFHYSAYWSECYNVPPTSFQNAFLQFLGVLATRCSAWSLPGNCLRAICANCARSSQPPVTTSFGTSKTLLVGQGSNFDDVYEFWSSLSEAELFCSFSVLLLLFCHWC